VRHTALPTSLGITLLALALPIAACKRNDDPKKIAIDPNAKGGVASVDIQPSAKGGAAATQQERGPFPGNSAGGHPDGAPVQSAAASSPPYNGAPRQAVLAAADIPLTTCLLESQTDSPAREKNGEPGAAEQIALKPGTAIQAKIVAYQSPKGAAQSGCFAGKLTSPLRVDGQVVAEAGSGARGVIQTLDSGTVLRLYSIVTLDGKTLKPSVSWRVSADSSADTSALTSSPVENTKDLDFVFMNRNRAIKIPDTVTFHSNPLEPAIKEVATIPATVPKPQ
jgi:hypothetical protein